MKNGKFEQKDLDDLNEIYKENGPMNWYELKEMVEELIEGNEGPSQEEQECVEFWTIVLESLEDVGSLFLYDVRDEDGYSSIENIMRTLHYDNGKPLTTDDYNYFEHYDRDQDFWGFFNDEYIDHFELDENGNLLNILEMTKRKLKRYLKNMYDGSSWEHDFH